ncbi:MAG: multifunctional CCA addition/repair protein [Legionella sp.]|jgi:tRNA nucleotidyltransferase (CCA-adding enzyme)
MKVYLVGGAVRDKLLGLPIHERDWVVVGANPEQMLAQKFRQVGKDFPVFLHPKTQEEYALARKERKSAPGYYGFECDYSTAVTLEEDLLRRDLTINAMAIDEKGNLIDPYNGQQDLQDKVLRHISAAFAEDPVRVLRVARFAARFHHLGFTIANETRQLMYQMVKNGELTHLVAERVWQEWQRSLQEKNPEQFILTLRACDALRVVLPELNALFGVPNPCHHHPEIDTGVHTLMVLQQAVTLTEDPVIRFAALVHDLGKAITPMSDWPSHKGHEQKGVAVIENLCQRLRIPNEYRSLAVLVSRFHRDISKVMELRAGTIVRLMEQADAFRRPKQFYDLLIACQADAQGRGVEIDYQPGKQWSYLLAECVKITSKHLIEQGYSGVQIKEGLHQRRVACVELILKSWKPNEK